MDSIIITLTLVISFLSINPIIYQQAEKEIAGLQNQRKKHTEETIDLNKQLTGDSQQLINLVLHS